VSTLISFYFPFPFLFSNIQVQEFEEKVQFELQFLKKVGILHLSRSYIWNITESRNAIASFPLYHLEA